MSKKHPRFVDHTDKAERTDREAEDLSKETELPIVARNKRGQGKPGYQTYARSRGRGGRAGG